jgi:hypothetical protein
MLFLNLIQSAGDSFQYSPNMILGDDSVGHSSKRELKRIGKPSPGLMARLGKSIAKQSEGRAGKKYLPVGGRVRSLTFLSILQRSSPRAPDLPAIEILLCRNGFSAAC